MVADHPDQVLKEQWLAADARQRTGFEDHQNDIGERNSGKIRTIINENPHSDSAKGRSRYSDTIEQLTLQALLQSDPDYAQYYHKVDTLLSRAEQLTEAAIERVLQLSLEAEDALQDILDAASTLEDGTKVFMDADGRVRAADGTIIDAAEAEGIVWKPGSPSYEEFTKQRQLTEETQLRLERLQAVSG